MNRKARLLAFVVASMVLTTAAYGFAVYGAIGEKWNAMGAAAGPVGDALSDEAATQYGGRFNRFQHGFIYWHPETGAHAVWGLIGAKWAELGFENYGFPITDESGTPDGIGRYNHFRAVQMDGKPEASIYWTPETGAHAIYGDIRKKWAETGWETFLGYPINDETGTPDGIGRYNHFRALHVDGKPEASIYWTPETGAHTIYGSIRGKWAELGWENGLGYPITDEMGTPDGIGRYNHFRSLRLPGKPEASIYWTPQTGAVEIYGDIRKKWAAMGWEQSSLGYPTGPEYQEYEGNPLRRQNFQRGALWWSPSTGVTTYSPVVAANTPPPPSTPAPSNPGATPGTPGTPSTPQIQYCTDDCSKCSSAGLSCTTSINCSIPAPWACY
jgi:uncharacterized protein with LGFP repeats